jgi:hypothetical protein
MGLGGGIMALCHFSLYGILAHRRGGGGGYLGTVPF